MTTTVTIKHEGPHFNDILVETVSSAVGRVSSSKRLKPGEQIQLHVYDSQQIYISELPFMVPPPQTESSE